MSGWVNFAAVHSFMSQPSRQCDVITDLSGLTRSDYDLLASLPLFSEITAESMRACLTGSRVRGYPRDTTLFSQGQRAARFFIVLDGWVKLFRTTADGQETVIGAFARGQPFALAAAIQFGTYPVNAEVVEHSRLLEIPAASFLRRARSDAALAMNMTATTCMRMHALVQQVERLTTRSATERLAEFLLNQCPNASGPVTVHLPHSKSLVAARLGMKPETFSRCLAKLRAHGVDARGGEIRIADVQALRALGETAA